MLVKPAANKLAFGESFGIDVPTKYSGETHSVFNTVMAVDSLITPMLFNMSGRTVWLCRMLALGLLVLRSDQSNLTLRYRLELETVSGVGLIVLGFRGSVSSRLFERLYLIIGGGMMIANALMTQLES